MYPSRMNILSYLTIFLYFLKFVKSDNFPFKFEHVRILDKIALDEFRSSANVRAVYYFKRDMARLRTFMKEYDKSAEFLEVYGVKFGVFDCRSQLEEEVCGTEMAEHNIYTYRQGATLLQLELQTMFDVNSIMSNILQLVLLREVPILQRREEREDFEYRSRGVRDIIFTFQKAIGTYEHRIFMEVAYAYSDNFQFAVSTSKQSLQNFDDMTTDDSVIWLLQCKDSQKVDPCPKIRYYGYMDLASLAQFVRALTFPKQFDIPSEGTTSPYAYTDNLNVIYMYYKADSRKTVMEFAEKLVMKYRGVYGIVTIDIENAEPPYPFNGETPAVGILIEGEVSSIFLEGEVTEANIFQFISKTAEEFNSVMVSDDIGDPSGSADGQDGQSVAGGEPSPFDESEILAVETQDDQVAEAVFRARRTEMDLTLVPKLTDKTFSNTVQHKDLLFILFYLPFDDKSMAFLRLYGDASRQLEFDRRNPLARVDCHDWTDVCARENVTIYPTLRIYRNGEKLRNYKGMLDTQNVVNTVKLLNHTDIIDLSSVSDIQTFLLGKLPSGMEIASDSMVLGLFESQHKKEMDIFRKVGKEMEDRIMFGVNKDGKGTSIAKEQFDTTLPAVIVVRQTDHVTPHTVYTGDFNSAQLEKFITEARIPRMPELTVKMFPDLYRQKKPFVISFLDDQEMSQKVKDTLSSIVKSEQFTEVIFCWIRATADDFGTKILKKYNPEGSTPAVALVNLVLGEVFNYDQVTFGSEELVSWIQGSLQGKSSPNTKLPQGDWKPLKEGYNFLAMMDWEMKNQKKVGHSRDAAEEYGIGFDEEGNEVKRSYEIKDDMSPTRSKSAFEEDQVRHELLALKKSRLYHHSGGRKKNHEEEGSDSSRVDEVKVTEDQVKVTGQDIPSHGQERHEEL
ncbi:thioredoxin domain-containing protein 16-like [Ylistrum balloti]|uniref:thioredoxin domain-containing protein 16-like n=1 Tax=Ylistrum balloti TaxID=509963 RepID=UPI002905B19F|nr:thioredoxin domain-containing protein 16-like [Ylistrum balloti]